MARYAIQDTIRDTITGQVISSATVTIYLAGGLTLATAYIDKVIGTALVGSQTTTDINGHFVVYVDTADYVATQNFKYIASKTGYTDWIKDEIHALDENSTTTSNGWIDVTNALYGATGDGATDDTTAIQAALDAVPTSNGVRAVYFPPGTYLITGALNLNKNNTTYRGEGDSSIIKTKNGVSDFTANFLIATGSNNITIKDLVLDGNADNNTTNTTHGIYALNSDHLTVKDCTVKNTPSHGIYLAATTLAHTNFNIKDNKLLNIGWRAIQVHKGQKGEVTHNQVVSSGNHGIGVTFGTTAGADSSYEVNISHNRVNRATSPTTLLTGQTESGMMIILGEGSHDCTIDNNICYDNRTAANDGIATVGTAGDTATIYRAITISNNTVTLAGGFGIDATSLCTVLGNIIDRPKTNGIVIAGDLEPLRKDIIIADNVIYGPNEGNVAGTAGIALNVQDNAAIGPFTWKRIKIHNNIVVDERSPKQVAYGLLINATNMLVNEIDVHDNNFLNVLTESIHVTNPSNVSNLRMHDNVESSGTVETFFWPLSTGATPTVIGHRFYTLAGGGATITNLLDGHEGQEVFMKFLGITTIDFTGNANLKGNNHVDFTSAGGDFMKCINKGGVWTCSVHRV